MKLTQEQKQAYVETIEILFDGAILATPDQITEEVAKTVDSMIADITKCSQRITSFGFSVIYKLTIDSVLGLYIPDLLLKVGTSFALSTLLKEWVLKLSSGYQFIGCLNTARANYRSKIQIELLEL